MSAVDLERVRQRLGEVRVGEATDEFIVDHRRDVACRALLVERRSLTSDLTGHEHRCEIGCCG
jgi:hypothetical protein